MVSCGWGKRRALGFAGSALLMAGVGAGAASASDSSSWFQFSDSSPYASALNQNFDRTLAKQWEANPPRGFPTLSKDNIGALNTAIRRYTDIVGMGGWTSLPTTPMAVGMHSPVVSLLRQRLAIEGDLKSHDGGEYFDSDVEQAVKRFQVRHGLTPNGKLDKQTIGAMNVSAQVRLKQLKTNYDRLRGLASGLPKKYVFVNIPAAQIEAIEGDKIVSRHAGVVGKIDRQTPILRSAIHELNFNPVWHLPPTVIQKDLIPRGREMARSGKDVLTKFKIDAYDGSGRKLSPEKVNWSSPMVQGLTYRQQPGADNPMGFVKINFHNAHSVYMHDTPSQTIFGRNFRAASSGCVRVMNIEGLVGWLLSDNDGWNSARVAEVKKSGERQDVRLKRPVPLYFAYVTAWATEDGMVHFRRDLYQRDGVGMTATAY